MSGRRYRAALVGLGNIAWKFDPRPGASAEPLSHAGALAASPRVELVAGCSPDAADRAGFSAAYGARAYESLDAMLEAERPELVSVCSPTPLHFAHAAACIEAGVSMVWLEKPPAASVDELDRLLALQRAARRRPTILVNYLRRYAGCYRRLGEALAAGRLGAPVALQVVYSRGLETNGSHLVDLAVSLGGDAAPSAPEGVCAPCGPENPWFTFRLASGLPVSVTGFPLSYHCADVVLTAEGGRASLVHGGADARWEQRVENELFPGFFRLADAGAGPLGRAGIGEAMAAALEDLLDAFEAGREPRSTPATARHAQALVEEALGRAARP